MTFININHHIFNRQIANIIKINTCTLRHESNVIPYIFLTLVIHYCFQTVPSETQAPGHYNDLCSGCTVLLNRYIKPNNVSIRQHQLDTQLPKL